MKTIIFFISLLIPGLLLSQNSNICVVLNDTTSYVNLSSLNCSSPNSFAFHKKYKHAETYIPKPGSRTKIINLNYNIFQDAAGNYNFPLSDPNSITKINNILSWVKWFFTSNSQPTDPVNCLQINDLNSKHIDFNINGVFFYQDNITFHMSCNITGFINYIQTIDYNRLKQMNYFASYGTYFGASGCVDHVPSLTHSVSYSGLNSGVVTFTMDINPWVSSQNMAHEIGHVLGLRHTYQTFVGGVECNKSHFDYLYDVHGPSSCSLCPHLGHWANPAASPNDGLTNNLMGGTIDNSYAGPNLKYSV